MDMNLSMSVCDSRTGPPPLEALEAPRIRWTGTRLAELFRSRLHGPMVWMQRDLLANKLPCEERWLNRHLPQRLCNGLWTSPELHVTKREILRQRAQDQAA